MARFCFVVGLLVSIPNLWFRASSFLAGRKYLAITKSLSTLSLGQTTKEEVFRLVPHVRAEDEGAKRNAEELYSAEFSNWNGPLLRMMQGSWGKNLHSVAYFCGYRALRYRVSFRFWDGKLNRYGYAVWIDDGSYGVPGIVGAEVSVRDEFDGIIGDVRSTASDENPDYQVAQYFKWPEKSLRVAITPAAVSALRQHAFDLQLDCLVTFRGCKHASSILPLVWSDEKAIDDAKRARLNSQAPCPQRIIRNLSRMMPDIFLAKARSIELVRSDWTGGPEEFTELQVMENIRVAKVGYGQAGRLEDSYFSRVPVPESARPWLRAGDDVILFADPRRYSGECSMVASTPETIAVVRETVASIAKPKNVIQGR